MNSPAERCVLIMAGGTGGHVFPALAVAESLRARGVTVHWLGTAAGIEARVVPAAGIELHCLDMSGFRGKGLLQRLRAIYKALAALFAASALMRRLRPVSVLGMGGYAAGPGGLAARLLGLPLLIHEQNAVAGTTNRLLAKLATISLSGFPIALGGDDNRFIGNPVRADIASLAPPADRWEGREGPLRLLILGGSLGALAINQAVVAAMALLPEDERPELWHQTGRAHIDSVQAAYREQGLTVRAEAFIDDMAAAYAWADVVLCRAGALTVAELTAAGVGAVLVPLPQAIDDHQRANARWLVNGGAGEILEQAKLTPEYLAEQIALLADRRFHLLQWAEAARALARPDAAERAADACLEFDAHG